MKLIKNQTCNDIVSILKLIQKKHPTAIVAGGAVRDLFLEKDVKDIDIFVQYDAQEHVGLEQCKYWWNVLEMSRPANSVWNESLDTLKIANRSDSDPDNGIEELAQDNQIECVFDGNKGDIVVNIVVLSIDPVTYVNDYFDIGLCKAYYDGTRFRFTSDFITDRDNHTLTVVGKHLNESRLKRVMLNHVPRLQLKYPWFQVKLADHNSHLLK